MGMVVGRYQLANLLGVHKGLTDEEVATAAAECAARFMRAYAPDA